MIQTLQDEIKILNLTGWGGMLGPDFDPNIIHVWTHTSNCAAIFKHKNKYQENTEVLQKRSRTITNL